MLLCCEIESDDLRLGKLKFWFCTKEVEDLQSEEIGGGKINTFPRKTLRDAFFANKYYLRHQQRAKLHLGEKILTKT